MSSRPEISSATLNRLSLYLRGLRELEKEGLATVSSQQLADRFHLSPTQIRKDLAHFGDFGVRGVGYKIAPLANGLHNLLGLDCKQRLVIVGMGNLGRALARYVGFNDDSFEVVGGTDTDPEKIGVTVGAVRITEANLLAQLVERTHADIGVLTVPTESALESYEALVASGVRAILNFAPLPLPERPAVHVKNVDLRIFLEETSFYARLSAVAKKLTELEP